MKTLASALVFATLVVASDSNGLKARPGPADYPAHESVPEVTIAAAVLTPDQAKSQFATDMREYLVIEVGVYPADGKSLDISTGDFALRAGGRGDIVRAANPRAIAAASQRKNAPQTSNPSDITLYPTATVGVGSGRDPITGRRSTGVYTGAGVGVGIGGSGMPPDPPGPASTDRDREVMQLELSDKMLPEGKTSAPVAGYLYFPLPAKAKSAGLELHYYAPSGKVRVMLPPVARR
jgi:hypothetical protein